MLQVQRFVNEMMSSNCYVLYDDLYDDCIVVDPGSEKCVQEQLFFREKNLHPTYVILTHEHTDHTWGTNTLIDLYDSKVACSKVCAENLPKDPDAYFSFYYHALFLSPFRDSFCPGRSFWPQISATNRCWNDLRTCGASGHHWPSGAHIVRSPAHHNRPYGQKCR